MDYRFAGASTVLAAFLTFNPLAYGCDLCAIHSAIELGSEREGAIDIGVTEQFTRFDRLQTDGHFTENEAHERIESSITRVVGRYHLTDRMTMQVAVPFIYRDFQRATEDGIEDSSESGVGDIMLLGSYLALREESAGTSAFLRFFGGLKLPSGDAHRLGEEAGASGEEEPEEAGGHHERPLLQPHHAGHEHGVASGIHGHDIALGSGSFDYIIGTSAFGSLGRYFAAADVQYTIRTEGSYGYRYANDLLWSAGPGVFVLPAHPATVAVRANLSGEYKEKDTFRGDKENDTARTSLFLGPELLVTGGETLRAHFAVDLPLDIENSGLQIVPDYRLRAGVSVRF